MVDPITEWFFQRRELDKALDMVQAQLAVATNRMQVLPVLAGAPDQAAQLALLMAEPYSLSDFRADAVLAMSIRDFTEAGEQALRLRARELRDRLAELPPLAGPA